MSAGSEDAQIGPERWLHRSVPTPPQLHPPISVYSVPIRSPEPHIDDRAPILASYLAHRDAPCPSCGYNLRGSTAPACPECGRELKLTLETRRYPDRARRNTVLFAAIVLAWSSVYALWDGYIILSLFRGMFSSLALQYTIQWAANLLTTVAITVIMARVGRRFLSSASAPMTPTTDSSTPAPPAAPPCSCSNSSCSSAPSSPAGSPSSSSARAGQLPPPTRYPA